MSIQPSPFLPALIHVHRHADNHTAAGVRFYPDDRFYTQVVGGIAHLVAFRRKLLYSRVFALGRSGGTSGTAHRWHCRAGAGCVRFVVNVLLGLDDRNVAVDPYLEVAITKVSGPTTTTMEFHGGESRRAGVDAPDELIEQTQVMDAVAGEVYTGTVTYYNNVRPVAIEVWEDEVPTVDDSNPPHSEWTPSAGSPILDSNIGVELDGVGDMLRYNGGLRFDWSMADGTARTRTSATPINLIDNSTTGTPSAGSPGVTFNTTARRTIAKNQVAVKAAVYGSVAGGGTALFKFRDTSGTDAASVTINNGTPQWFTATGALTVGSAQKYDPMFYSDGVNQVSILAVSVYEEG